MCSRNRIVAALVFMLILRAASAAAFDANTVLSQYTLTIWTEKDGLPSVQVTAIAQDVNGYLWLGTGAGLIRFDGFQFVRWEDPNATPFATSGVLALLAARDGSLWVASANGGVFRVKDDHVQEFTSRDGPFEGLQVALLQDPDGTIWTGGARGIARIRAGYWEQLADQHGFTDQPVYSLHQDQQGNLWVGTAAGVFRRTPGEDKFELILPLSYPIARSNKEDSGTTWLMNPQDVVSGLLGAAARRFDVRFRTDESSSHLLHDRDANLWVGTSGHGLLRTRGGRTLKGPITEHITRQDGLPNDFVRTLFEDREGNIWVGTERGLAKFSKNTVTPVGSSEGLPSDSVRAVTMTNDGSIWVATALGLSRFSGEHQQTFGPRDGLPSADVSALHSDANGVLWVATAQGLARFIDGRFAPAPLPRVAELTRIRAMTTERDGLWLCLGYGGLYHWKRGDVSLSEPSQVRRHPCASAITDRTGRVWIGFSTGILAEFQHNKVRLYSDKDGLAPGAVTAIYEDNAGTIWVGTRGGLSRFENERFVTVTARNGLSGNRLSAIVEDADRALWLGVNDGIMRVSRTEFERAVLNPSYRMEYELYGPSDGLRGVPFQSGHPRSIRARDGALWFTTTNGITVVNPRRTAVPAFPPVLIESVAVNDRRGDAGPSAALNPHVMKLQIDYTAIHLAAPATLRFRYKLEGFDHDWVDAGDRRQAFYTNLPHGSYRFRVSASNSHGAWTQSDASTTWNFSVQPTFFETRGFYAACAMGVALVGWSAWRLRLRHVRGQFSLVLAERTRISREIHDTLLQSLVGVALQCNAIAEAVDSSPDSAKHRLWTLRKHMEHYIRETRQSIRDLRSPTLEATDLATALREAGTRTTAGKTLQFELVVRGQTRRCSMTVEEQLLRIGEEALNNAARHAEAKEVRVELSYDDRDFVRLRVSDDGRGFDPDDLAHAAGGRYGLISMRERAQRIGAQLKLASAPGRGTELELVARSR